MFVTVAYDIVDDKIRNKAAKILSEYGRRVQKSVFECLIDDGKYLKMKERLDKLIDKEQDTVRYYILCRRCTGNIEVTGWGTVEEDDDVIIV